MIYRRCCLLQLVRQRCSVAALNAVRALEKRGLVHQTTRIEAVPPLKGSGVYVGFDPTADSLHIGNLLSIITLLHFQRHGYQPIAVIGGATGVVGDPSGRTQEREELAAESLERNKAGLEENIHRVFLNANKRQAHPSSCLPLKVYDNAEWWGDVRALEFVSGISRHFRLASMLRRESVKQRLDSDEGMSCAEFLYPIFQSYDFLQLHKKANCWIQIGGRDQWGNIMAGVDFVKRVTGNHVHGVTLPLLTTSSGEKLGKSTGNSVWLTADRSSPYHLYQYFVQRSDQEVGEWLGLFTFLPMEEIQKILAEHKMQPEKFGAQKYLAESVTRLVHGDDGVLKAKNATAVLFGDKAALSTLTASEVDQLFSDAPCFEVTFNAKSEDRLVEIFHKAGLFSSLGEVESLVRKGGLYVNFERVPSTGELFQKEKHVLLGRTTIVRIGKKQYKLIQWRM